MTIAQRIARVCGALLLASTTLSVGADFRDIALAYQRGDFSAATTALLPLAEGGDAVAQYLLGSALANAKPPLHDLADAERWLLKAAAQGHIAAMRDLGQLNLYYRKPADRPAAEKWLLAAADRGETQSQHLLGVMYLDPEGGERKPVEACKWLVLAAQRGHLLSAVMLRLPRAPFSEQERQEGTRLASEWKPIP